MTNGYRFFEAGGRQPVGQNSDNEVDPDIWGKVQRSFAAQGMMRTVDAKIISLEPGRCIIRAPISDRTGQQQGFAHAGLTFSLGDSASGYAALSQMDLAGEVVTAEMKINLLAPATGMSLRAEGRVLRAGRRLFVVSADVFSEGMDRDDRHVAALLGTMVRVEA